MSGKESQWREWSFQLRVAVKAMEGTMAELMARVEGDENAYDLQPLELEFTNINVTKAAGELYDILCMCVKGDPLILIQGVTSMNGLEAWGRLYRRYNPVTPARALQAVISVLTPGKVKDQRDLTNEIEKWEGRLLLIQREYKETLSERMKIAAVTSMCPSEIQDLIFQQGDKLDDYLKVRDQIKAIILNRVTRIGGPTPMDIGGVGGSEDEGYDWPEEEWPVDGVNTQCHNCGGFGHYSSECPSKGKGKSGTNPKGKSKGKGKNNDSKGKGKGKAGKGPICWNCQKNWPYLRQLPP